MSPLPMHITPKHTSTQRGRNKDAMLEWLAKDVGIRRHHCHSIINFLAHEMGGAVRNSGAAGCNLTLAVEGNIRCVGCKVVCV